MTLDKENQRFMLAKKWQGFKKKILKLKGNVKGKNCGNEKI